MAGNEWKRVGDRVVARRVELGMKTTKALADHTGLTARMLGDIENGRRDNYTRGTITQIEAALQWRNGSIANILAGGEPTPAGAHITDTQYPSSPAHGVIINHTRLLVDLAIEADEVDSSAAFLNTDVSGIDDVEQLLGELDSLLIDIDRLTQHINDEALEWVGGPEVLRALKSDAIRRRRLLRLGRKDVGPDLVARMVEIQREVSASGMTENEFVLRLLAEAERSANQYPEPDMFEQFIKKEKTDDVETAPAAGASGEAHQVEEDERLGDQPKTWPRGTDWPTGEDPGVGGGQDAQDAQ